MDFFALLAQLDIGKASFLALVALFFWHGREMVRTLKSIERSNHEVQIYMRESTRILRELTGVLKRKNIEIREITEVK